MMSRNPKGALCQVCQQTKKVGEVLPLQLVRPGLLAVERQKYPAAALDGLFVKTTRSVLAKPMLRTFWKKSGAR